MSNAGMKPCPFCGSNNTWAEEEFGEASAQCFDCDAVIDRENTTREQVVAAWNRRHSDAAPGEAELGREDVYRLQDTVKDIQAIIGGVPDGMTTADAVQARISFGDELIAWAADEDNLMFEDNGTRCCFCDLVDGSYMTGWTHADDCLHLRARALRDNDRTD